MNKGSCRAWSKYTSGQLPVGNGPPSDRTPANLPRVLQAEPKRHRAARLVAGQEDPVRGDAEFLARHFQAIEDALFRRRHVRVALRPGEAGPARRTRARTARSDRHEITHAHQRHHALQLPLVIPGTVQPDHQRIGVIAFVVQRGEQRIMTTRAGVTRAVVRVPGEEARASPPRPARASGGIDSWEVYRLRNGTCGKRFRDELGHDLPHARGHGLLTDPLLRRCKTAGRVCQCHTRALGSITIRDRGDAAITLPPAVPPSL